MRRIPEQCDPASGPLFQWLPVVQGGDEVLVRGLDEAREPRFAACQGAHQVFVLTALAPGFPLELLGRNEGGKVEELLGPDPVADGDAAGAPPAVEALLEAEMGHLVRRDQGPPGDGAGIDGLGFAEERVAHYRVHAVCPDDDVGVQDFPRFESD